MLRADLLCFFFLSLELSGECAPLFFLLFAVVSLPFISINSL